MVIHGAYIAGLFGLIVGSYLNVLILRLHTGQSTSGRSGCMSCATQLKWYELLPVVSFMVLRGRCRTCGSALLQQYWLVELGTAILFALVWIQQWDWWTTLLTLALMCTLVVIATYDMRHTIIPNGAVYAAGALAIMMHIPQLYSLAFSESAMYLGSVVIATAVTAAPLLILWGISRGSWMGFGDVKLAAVFGIFLGMYDGLMALMLGFIVGACIGLILLGLQRVVRISTLSWLHHRLTIKSEIPFAPFLIVGFLLVLFWDVDFIALVAHLV